MKLYMSFASDVWKHLNVLTLPSMYQYMITFIFILYCPTIHGHVLIYQYMFVFYAYYVSSILTVVVTSLLIFSNCFRFTLSE